MISEVKVYYENRINIQEENFNKEKKKLSKIHDEKIAGVLEKNTDLEKKISNWQIDNKKLIAEMSSMKEHFNKQVISYNDEIKNLKHKLDVKTFFFFNKYYLNSFYFYNNRVIRI